MKFSAARETLLKPLQTVVGVVERRQTMPILSNVLLSTQGSKLSITATDLEVEMVAEAEVKGDGSGDITVPGRKLHDIFRALPEGSTVEFSLSGERLTVKAARRPNIAAPASTKTRRLFRMILVLQTRGLKTDSPPVCS